MEYIPLQGVNSDRERGYRPMFKSHSGVGAFDVRIYLFELVA